MKLARLLERKNTPSAPSPNRLCPGKEAGAFRGGKEPRTATPGGPPGPPEHVKFSPDRFPGGTVSVGGPCNFSCPNPTRAYRIDSDTARSKIQGLSAGEREDSGLRGIVGPPVCLRHVGRNTRNVHDR